MKAVDEADAARCVMAAVKPLIRFKVQQMLLFLYGAVCDDTIGLRREERMASSWRMFGVESGKRTAGALCGSLSVLDLHSFALQPILN